MSTRIANAVVAWIFATSVLSGCALTSKSDALNPKYYTPEPVSAATTAKVKKDPSSPIDLRMGRISAAADLKENIAFRDGDHEVGYYDERLWTERPDAYLQRALSQTLFEQRGIRHILSGAGPTLDVRLLAFEEVHGTTRAVRIRVGVTLHDDRVVLLEETLTLERPLSTAPGTSTNAQEVAKALGDALGAMVQQIGDRVEASLATSVSGGLGTSTASSASGAKTAAP